MNAPVPKVLMVDDEPRNLLILEGILAPLHYDLRQAENGREALEQVAADPPDMVLLDVMMPDVSGFEVCRRLKSRPEMQFIPVVLVTVLADRDSKITGIEAGADDFISKPVDPNELRARVQSLLRIKSLHDELHETQAQLIGKLKRELQLERENRTLRMQVAPEPEVVSHSPRMQEVLDMAWRVANTASTVLLRGESGTGKEVIARAIHRRSPYREGSFIPVHCAALPASLLESELFGHEKGAFTGATAQRQGRFELADGGTLFLDEVGELDPEIQVKLLRVLQERKFERVGGSQTIEVDVRMIAATNRNLEEAIDAGTFREDLYYRLNVIPILLPSLRERREDIPMLVDHFLDRYTREVGRPMLRVSSETMDLFLAYTWPENIREPQNLIERMVVVAEGETILPRHLPPEVQEEGLPVGPTDAPKPSEELPTLAEVERKHVEAALVRCGWNQSQAARLLDITRDQLRHRIKRYGLQDSRRAGAST